MKIAQNSQAVCAMHRYEKTFIIKIQEKAGYEYEKNDNFENHNVKAGFSFVLGEK